MRRTIIILGSRFNTEFQRYKIIVMISEIRKEIKLLKLHLEVKILVLFQNFLRDTQINLIIFSAILIF
jgi:hypothetical protein